MRFCSGVILEEFRVGVEVRTQIMYVIARLISVK